MLNFAWRDHGNRVGAWRLLDMFGQLALRASVLLNTAMYDHAPDLLHEAGYAYVLDWCMDDQPVWMRTRKGRILSVPDPQQLDDIPTIVGRKLGGDAFAAMIIDTFDEMLDQSRSAPLVMGIALHPYLAGQPHRLRHLRRALRHIAGARDSVWLTTAGAVASYCHTLPPSAIA